MTWMRMLRMNMEQDPVIVFSCFIGGLGCLLPLMLGDGGRKREDASTTYAYRIKHMYPGESSK